MFSSRTPRCKQAAAGDDELALAASPGRTRRATFDSSSLSSRSRSSPAGERLAVLPGERRVVDAEHHVQRRLVDGRSAAGRRRCRSRQMVSPMSTSSSPTTAQMSPAATSSTSRFGRAGRTPAPARPCRRCACRRCLTSGDAAGPSGSCRRRPGRWRSADVIAVLERRRPASAAARPRRRPAAGTLLRIASNSGCRSFGRHGSGRWWRCRARPRGVDDREVERRVVGARVRRTGRRQR